MHFKAKQVDGDLLRLIQMRLRANPRMPLAFELQNGKDGTKL